MGSINHEQAQEFLHLRPDELNETERQSLQVHLAVCPECRAYAASLSELQGKLRLTFKSRWDGLMPVKSRTGGILIRLGVESKRLRISALVGTAIGVLGLIALVLSLDFVLSNLRPQPAILPFLPTASPTFQRTTPQPIQPTAPSSTDQITRTPTQAPSVTPIPEGSIVLNWGHAILPPDPEAKAYYADYWAHGLSNASSLNVVAVLGPTTDMEILQALRDGEIDMAQLNPLAFGYGLAKGWILPGPVLKYTYQPDGRLMFVSRKDTGLVAGESPQMYQQLTGKHPCYPDLESFYQLPLYEYIAPAGLLAQKGVVLDQPVFNPNPRSEGMLEAELVFLKKCDFAVLESEPVAGFMSLWFPDLVSKGFNFNDWTTDMQVLYYTPPLVPYDIMGFSSRLDSATRESLTKALLSVPTYEIRKHWVPFDTQQAAFYSQFQSLVSASGIDVAGLLSRVWDPSLRSLINASQTPSPTLTAPPTPKP